MSPDPTIPLPRKLLDILDYSGERVVTKTSSYSGEKVIDNEAHFLSLFNRSGFEGGKAPAIVLDDGTFVISLGIGYQKEKRIRKDSSVNHILEYLTESEFLSGSGKNGVIAEKGLAIRAGDSFQFLPFHSEFQVFAESKKCVFVRPADFMIINN